MLFRKTRRAHRVAIHFTIGSFNSIFSVVTLLPNNKDKTRILIDDIEMIDAKI